MSSVLLNKCCLQFNKVRRQVLGCYQKVVPVYFSVFDILPRKYRHSLQEERKNDETGLQGDERAERVR